ncbi:uncharacterized protein LOC135137020 [Zophobas morio]|uniref:uncharacterized protein LOC135137020 n=1 Tax=Zophobas morio TaxID=2755281 RepID=UPI003083C0AB
MFGRIAKLFKDPESSDSDINLLLLGGTGVGKSTFINSISNYFKYPDFKSAQKGEIEVLIPVRLNLSNSNVVYGDPDKNEIHDSGKSATQHVKVYLFPIKVDNKVYNLRIVDSPGVGDPRGIEQDNIHIDNILAYLSTLKKLHGICFIMKSNETRFTSFVEYCLKQMLTRLDKSASENIIFITTYSKSTQYTPRDTKINCLEPLVNNIKSKPPHVDIPLNDRNVFSLDNEAFKALLEIQEGNRYKNHEMDSFTESWKVSSQECRRLLTYIIGDARTSPLKPHEVENTISINEVRFLIEQLSTPIAEVSEIIQDNLLLLDRHKKNLNVETQSLDQLRQQLYIPCVDLTVTELSQPVTVCTDTSCAEVVKVNNVTQWHYVQKCHNPCYLSGVPREMVGDPGLTHCYAMQGTENCTECKCSWRVHMHIYKSTEKTQTQKEDTNVRDAIKNKEDARVKIENLMKDLNTRMRELEAEGDIIAESVARFSFFLQEHALTPFNDAYSDYIKQLIKNEKSLGKFGDPMVIQKLEQLLQKHEHLQRTLQQNAKKFAGAPPNLTPQAIKNSISDLYKLKHMGAKIEELIKKSSACRNKETQQNFNCVVSPQVHLNDSHSIYGGNEPVYQEDPEYEYGSQYSYGRSEYYSPYYDSNRSRRTRSPSASEYSRYEERQYRAPSSRSGRSSRSRQYSGSDDETYYYRSPMSEYYASKSTTSNRRSSDSDSSGTYTYVSSSKSTRDRGSDHDAYSRYTSGSRSVRSTRSTHDTPVKYHTSSRSVRSSSRRSHSDDDTYYEPSSRSVRSTRSQHRGSDDEKSIRSSRSDYYSTGHSQRSSRSKHSPDSARSHRSNYSSGRSSRPQLPLPDSDDHKSGRHTRPSNNSRHESGDKSSRRHSRKSDDEKSVRSSRSEYYSKGGHSEKSSYDSKSESRRTSDGNRSDKYDTRRSRDKGRSESSDSKKSPVSTYYSQQKKKNKSRNDDPIYENVESEE